MNSFDDGFFQGFINKYLLQRWKFERCEICHIFRIACTKGWSGFVKKFWVILFIFTFNVWFQFHVRLEKLLTKMAIENCCFFIVWIMKLFHVIYEKPFWTKISLTFWAEKFSLIFSLLLVMAIQMIFKIRKGSFYYNITMITLIGPWHLNLFSLLWSKMN